MIKKILTYRIVLALLLCLLQVAGIEMYAQNISSVGDSIPPIPKARLHRIKSATQKSDSLITDSLMKINARNLEKMEAPVDTSQLRVLKDTVPPVKEQKIWFPNPTRSVWLATVIPGGGQIYNRKYWKLPIVYGGFVGCAYALTWNNKMYKDYSQAYLDIMDSDPNTNSYLDFLPVNVDLTGRDQWLKDTFKRKKDFYRRNRDLSIFCFIGVYLISIIDAYVDAELSNFDISQDLGFKIEPTIINNGFGQRNSWGLQCSCSIKF